MPDSESGATPPEIPEQFRDAYRRAYEAAMIGAEQMPSSPKVDAAPGPDSVGEEATASRPPAYAAGRLEPPARTTEFRTARPVWYLPLVVVCGALVLVGCAYVLGRMVAGDTVDDTAPASRSQETTATTPTPLGEKKRRPATPWRGKVRPVDAVGAEADCTAEASEDARGRTVQYPARHMIDRQRRTAWRCEGDAIGTRLTFRLPEDTRVGQVGLIPGYAKTDRKSGADRYAENNRITRATWILADGTEVEQRFSADPNDRSLRRIRVPATEGDQVTLRIEAVATGKRNTTMISEVRVWAAAR